MRTGPKKVCAALMFLALWGCGGGDDQPAPNAGGGAGAVVGVAPTDLVGGDAGRANAGAQPANSGQPAAGAPPGGENSGNPPPGQENPDASQQAISQSSGEELLQFLPATLKSAVGIKFSQLSGDSNPMGQRLLSNLAPVTAVLKQAGIATNQVENMWAGSNRTTGDLLMCVRTRGRPGITTILKGLNANTQQEKIGKAQLYAMPDHAAFKNSVAVIDARTFLIGRHDTVVAGLKNPAAGAVRWGLETLQLAQVSCWIAGDETAMERQAQNGALTLMARGSVSSRTIKPRGVAIGLRSTGSDASGTQPNDGTSPQAAPPDSQPTADSHPAPADSPETGFGSQPFEVTIGMSFPNEGIATAGEARLNDALKTLTQAAAAMRAVQEGRAAADPNNPNPDQNPAQGANPPTEGANNSATPPPDNASPQADGAPGQTTRRRPRTLTPVDLSSILTLQREKEKLRLTLKVPASAGQLVVSAFNDLLNSVGAGAVGDGIFEGSLSVLSRATQAWITPEGDASLKGVKRVGELMVQGGYSWLTELLPHMGRDDLYHQIDFSKSLDDSRNLVVASNVIPAFLNPQDSRSQWKGYPFNGLGLTHFVGMAGVEDGRNVVAATLPRSDPRAGVFGYDAIMPLKDITDGTSQTIMVIGSGRNIANPWIQGGGATIRGARQPYFDDLTGFGSVGLPKPGSFVMFADGSSRVISADINPEVFKAMCTAHGAEKVDLGAQVTANP